MRFLPLLVLLSLPALAGERPRAGVVVVVDQLSAEAFRERLPLAKAGFKRLASEGLSFHELRYEAAPTITSIGHATLLTGTYGELHGITANEWFDGAAGQPRYSTEDSAFAIVGRPGQPRDGTAPTAMRVPTLGEAMEAANPASRTLVISGKDRSAILSAGRVADAVLWFDTAQPMFVTSTFFAQELPAWVRPINEKLQLEVVKGAFAWGLPAGGITGKNPPVPTSGRSGDREPFAERPELQAAIEHLEVDVALAGVKALEFGQDEVPDLLVVSFSGHDRIGHEYGPQAPEALAEFLALDVELGRLLDGLDAQVGKGRYVVALTSDHGVAPRPEVVKARGLDAGHLDTKALREAMEKEADAALGPGDWFAMYKTPGLFATPANREKLHTIDDRLCAVAKAQPGIFECLPQPKLAQPGTFGALGDLYRRGLSVGHSPDFLVVTRPYWTSGLADHTGHASPWLYDRAVPLVFWGPGVKKGEAGQAEAIDVAPTLARLLHVPPPPAAQGRPIPEVFR